MNGLIATTDFDWYRHLSSLPDVDEVNFWQPSSYRKIHSIQRGEPLLFKLKAPHNAICGFGLFAGGSELEASLAWDAFGEKNGDFRGVPWAGTRFSRFSTGVEIDE